MVIGILLEELSINQNDSSILYFIKNLTIGTSKMNKEVHSL